MRRSTASAPATAPAPAARPGTLALPLVLAAMVALGGCGAGAPDAASQPGGDPAPPAPAAATTAPPPPSPAECSGAATPAALPPQPQLPPAVARTREAVFAAARSCDWAALDALAADGLRYTFGEGSDPLGHWQALEERGEGVLGTMAEVLRLQPAVEHGLWVWPGLFLSPPGEWSAHQRADAARLLGPHAGGIDAAGGYLGYRLGITTAGEWVYFVAGD